MRVTSKIAFAIFSRPRLAVLLNGSTSLRLFESHATKTICLLRLVAKQKTNLSVGVLFGGEGGIRTLAGTCAPLTI